LSDAPEQSEVSRPTRRKDKSVWPGPPPTWLFICRIIVWGCVALPAVLFLILELFLVLAHLLANVPPVVRADKVERASEVVIAVGVAFAIDRLLSTSRY
jgi:hypothetical protein